MVVRSAWRRPLDPGGQAYDVKVAVFSPGCESRSLLGYPWEPVPDDQLTNCEQLLRRIGKEIYEREITIVGLPLTERATLSASIEDYLANATRLLRAVSLLLLPHPRQVDGVLFVAPNGLTKQLAATKDWVSLLLPATVDQTKIVWLEADPRLGALLDMTAEVGGVTIGKTSDVDPLAEALQRLL